MLDELEWIEPQGVDLKKVIEVEKELGVKFPKDFHELILNSAGGSPSLDSFDIDGRDEAVLGNLLAFDPNVPHTYIVKIWEILKNKDIDGIIPIASDPFGNRICYDYRINNEKPTIVFYDHELPQDATNNFKFIANSFTDFLNMLYEE